MDGIGLANFQNTLIRFDLDDVTLKYGWYANHVLTK